jgi:hypothetical protein
MWLSAGGTSSGALFDVSNGNSVDNIHFLTNIGLNSTECPTGRSFFEVKSSSGATTTACPATVASWTVGAWFHFAVTYSSATLTSSIYVNGVLQGSAGSQLKIANVSRAYCWFGTDAWGNRLDFVFDEIKFHDRALSAQEILND